MIQKANIGMLFHCLCEISVDLAAPYLPGSCGLHLAEPGKGGTSTPPAASCCHDPRLASAGGTRTQPGDAPEAKAWLLPVIQEESFNFFSFQIILLNPAR